MIKTPRIKQVKIYLYSWGERDKIVDKIIKEVDRKTRKLNPDFDTIEKALEQKHKTLISIANKYNRKPEIIEETTVVREDQINWSNK